MSELIIRPFQGEAVREQRLNTTNVYASCAINARLRDGALSSFPCPEEICEHDFKPKAIFSYEGCDCIAWENNALVEQTRDFIITYDERHGARKSAKGCFCEGVETYLGIPCPISAPTASGGGSGCNFDPRVYYYSYVAKHCDGCVSEGPLSPPSASVNCGGGATVGSMASPPTGHGITHTRIYRANAGDKTGGENQTTNNSGALLVGEVPVGSGFSDNVAIGDSTMIGPITFDMESMPSDAEGVGVTAFSVFAWKGKDLYISVDGMVDVYRDYGHFCFDHEVLMAKYWNGSIYVFTKRWNYRIDEQAGDGAVRYSNPPYRYENLAPIHNPYSVSVGQTGVAYVAKAGVGILAGNDSALLGSGIFSTDQWKSMKLDNAKTHIYQQMLFVFSEDWDYTHIIEFEDNHVADIAYSNHVRYPYSISAMFTTDGGDLRFASDGVIYRFVEEECDDVTDCDYQASICRDCCPYDYRIDTRGAVEVTDWATAYVNVDPFYGDVTFRLWMGDCGDELLFEKTLSGCHDHEFKLPGCGPLRTHHTVQLEGCAKVYELRIGTNAKLMGRN